MTPLVVALVDDLLFTSRIKNIVTGHGGHVVFARVLGDVFPGERPVLILADLEHRRFDALTWLQNVRVVHADVPVMTFCSHVKTSLAQSALYAGYTEVLTRGSLAKELEDWFSCR